MTRRFPDLLALAIFPLAIFGTLVLTGNLTTGPRIIDDNQIYKLQIELSESGFLGTLSSEIGSRLAMGRLVPVYNTQKIVLAWLLGGNLAAWSLWTGLVGVLTAGLLYGFARLSAASPFEALAFALISLLGEQSILWWRLLHGEGIGMLFLAAALVSMALHIRSGALRHQMAFCLLATFSVLSKESFILAMPAVMLLLIFRTSEQRGLKLREAVKRSFFSIMWISGVSVAALAIILLGFRTMRFKYAGWAGFDAQQFSRIVGQYVKISNLWVVPTLLLILMSVSLARKLLGGGRRLSGQADRPSIGGVERDSTGIRRSLALAVLFWAAMTLPQLLIYMKTGLLVVEQEAHFSRYILPCMLGHAYLVTQILRLIRLHAGGRRLAVLLAVFCVLASLAERTTTAIREGLVFAQYSKTNDLWFETIVRNTDAASPIVLVYLNGIAGGGDSTQAALRVYYILSARHGRQNLYYFPIPPKPTIEEGRLAALRPDTRHHALKMRSVEQLEHGREVQAVLALNWGVFRQGQPRPTSLILEEALLEQRPSWFDPTVFRRVAHPHGHVSYFRPREMEILHAER